MIKVICWIIIMMMYDHKEWHGWFDSNIIYLYYFENNIWIERQYEIDNLTVLRTPPTGAYTLAIDCPEDLRRQ